MVHILLVEDDDHYRNELASKLENAGFKVSAGRDGQGGLDILKKEHIDMVVLDLAMPNMDGITFYYYLEETYKTHVPVVIVTSASHAAYPSNVKDFINKMDYTLDQVVEKIKMHLSSANKM